MTEVKPGKPMTGRLNEFREMGRGGIMWSITSDSDKATYDLHDGDLLTVFNDASRTSILWEGEVKIVPIKGAEWPDPTNTQAGEPADKWQAMFREAKPATVETKNARKPMSW